ncbi:MAG TPA: MFS transporter [Polyangiales bacterium]|nr:MFS transporter [Polyangiales bacterium]
MRSLGGATFFVFGIVLVLLGANQAELARSLELDLARSGFLGAILALGLGAGVLIAGPLADRFPHRPLFIGSCLLAAAGLGSVDDGRGYVGVVLLLLIAGLGCGIYDTVVNAAVVRQNPERSASALALVHSLATLGAGIGPLLIRYWLSHGHWARTFHALAVLHVVLALWGLFSPAWSRHGAVPDVQRVAADMAWPALIALSIVAFAYVGVENGITVFAVPWAQSRGESEAVGQWSISSLWSGLFIGRLGLVLRPPRRGLSLLAVAGLGGAAIVCATSMFELGPLVLATGFAGVVLGPVYPLMIALVAQRFPERSGTALGLVAGAGAAGGFAVPWLIGVLGDAWGVRPALTLLGASALFVSAAALGLSRRDAAALEPAADGGSGS